MINQMRIKINKLNNTSSNYPHKEYNKLKIRNRNSKDKKKLLEVLFKNNKKIMIKEKVIKKNVRK
jgi:hypothetical protein